MKFSAPVLKFEKGLWAHHIIVPEEIYLALTKKGNKRVLCSFNGHDNIHAGFMPDGKGQWFIKISNDKMKAFNLSLGENVSVILKRDTSKYGMKVSQEFEEVLSQDVEGAHYFEALTDGKKRSLIFLVEKVQSSDKRITKTLVILDHLKANQGKLDFKLLNQAIKDNPY